MKQLAIIYGSTTDNTKTIAKEIAKRLSDFDVTLLDVANLKVGALDTYPNLILGTSTWGLGDLQDDWDSYLSNLKNSNLEGKTIALYGLGDSSSYPDTFVNGLGILYKVVESKGANLIGKVSAADYDFEDSEAVREGEFVGLALDEDNESDKTADRLDAWVTDIREKFGR